MMSAILCAVSAELLRRDRERHRHERRLLDDVDEREAHVDAAIGQRLHRAHDDGVRVARTPRRRLDRPRRAPAAERRRSCRRGGTCPSARDRRRRRPEMPSGHVPSLPNGTTAIGIAAPAPPTISIDSCACASGANNGEKASSPNGKPATKQQDHRMNFGGTNWTPELTQCSDDVHVRREQARCAPL